jgi:hypothetical protein
MEVQSWEAFKVWVIETSEKDVDLEADVFWNARLDGVEVEPSIEGSNEIENVDLLAGILSVLPDHLLVGQLNHIFDQEPDSNLLLNWGLEVFKHGFGALRIINVVGVKFEELVLLLLCFVSLHLLVDCGEELL